MPRDYNEGQLYQLRREQAIAVWQRVPAVVFTPNQWVSENRREGCALGWLGLMQHDGWSLDRPHPRRPIGPDGSSAYDAAAHYFGITLAEATACFGPTLFNWSTKRFHNVPWYRKLTLPDISRSLLALPVGSPVITRVPVV